MWPHKQTIELDQAYISLLPHSSLATIPRPLSFRSEYGEVLGRSQFRFPADKIGALLDFIRRSGRIVVSFPLPISLPDPGDQPFLEIAVAGRATCLVTGNRAHFPTRLCQGGKVFSPSEFLVFYKKQHRQKTT